jgi:RNA polymerase sigma-70 factor (ECF subfamily)
MKQKHLTVQAMKQSACSVQSADHLLIQQAVCGNQAAYAQILQRYERLVASMVRRYLDNDEDIRETIQDSFMRAFRFLPDFRGEARFSTWLAKIAITTALDRVRAKRHITFGLEQVPPCAGCPPEVVRQMEGHDRHHALRQALRLLSPEDAQVLTLFYFQEQSLEEICFVTGITLTNAKSRLCRARQRLRSVLEKNFDPSLWN